MSVRLCFSTGICSPIVCTIFKSMFARQKISFSWITSPHCAKMVPHGSMIYQTRISEKRSGNKRCKPRAMNMLGFPRRAWVIIIGLTYHGAPPTFSGRGVLSRGGSGNYIGLRFDGTTSEEGLPMSRSGPGPESARVRQHVRSSFPQNQCSFWEPEIVDCAMNTHG